MIFTNLKSPIPYLKFITCLGLSIVSFSLFSQQQDTAKAAALKHKILLVPFKTTMLMSEIGKAVNTKTHLGYNKIAEAFRYHMDLALYTSFRQTYLTISLIQTPKKGDTTLAYIYSSIGYKYDLLPGQDSLGETHEEFDPKQQKAHFVHNGQLQVPMDYSKRFMNTTIDDPQILPYLHKKYGIDILVFINEMDIRNVSNNETDDLTESNARREVMVQYSILSTQNHYLAKGILSAYFPYSENDPKIIGEQYFTVIAQSMLSELNKRLQKIQVGKSQKPTASETKTISSNK